MLRRLLEHAGGPRAGSDGSESGQMDPSRFDCDKKKETQMAGASDAGPGTTGTEATGEAGAGFSHQPGATPRCRPATSLLYGAQPP